MDRYCIALNIEALTMADMVKKDIIPSCVDYERELIDLVRQKKAYGGFDVSLESNLLENISKLTCSLLIKLKALEKALADAKEDREITAKGSFFRDTVLPVMSELRFVVDELETLTARKHWQLPVYGEMLFSVI